MKQKIYYNNDGVSTRKTECYLETSPNNVQVFYSYSTPMALITSNNKVYVFNCKISATTSKHMNIFNRHVLGYNSSSDIVGCTADEFAKVLDNELQKGLKH